MIAVGRVGAVCALVISVFVAGLPSYAAQSQPVRPGADPVVTTLYPIEHAKGLMVTTGGWVYCAQMRPIARRARYTLLCGRYVKDGYLGPGLRSRRHLEWGDPGYLTSFAAAIRTEHRRVGSRLILIGVSYSGFGVAVLASRHPNLRPDQVIVVDSYLDLLARRRKLPDRHETAREIDLETGGSETALRKRSVSVEGFARLVRTGTRLTVIWSVAPAERRLFRGATCDREANAQTLARLALMLGRPFAAWVTENQHGRDLWGHGVEIVNGTNPGRRVVFGPDGKIPATSVCTY